MSSAGWYSAYHYWFIQAQIVDTTASAKFRNKSLKTHTDYKKQRENYEHTNM